MRYIHLVLVFMLVSTVLFVFVPSFDEPVSAAWTNPGYKYFKRIVIDYTKVNAWLKNFPILFDNTSASFSNAQSDGDDFVFVSGDNTTKYAHEIESYNSTSKRLIAWVNVTSLSKTANTILYVYYGNSTVSSQQNKFGTWNSNYKGVYHMRDYSTSQTNDSTINLNHLTKASANNPKQDNGKINRSQNYSADSASAVGSVLSTGAKTISFIAKSDIEVADSLEIICNGAALSSAISGFDVFYVHKTAGDKFGAALGNGLTAGYFMRMDTGGTITETNWNEVAFVYDNTNFLSYLNGVNDNTTGTKSGAETAPSIGLKTGYYGATNNLDGCIDEIQLSNVARNNSWIRCTYNTTFSPSTFLSVGTQSNAIIYPAAPEFFHAMTQNCTKINLNWTKGSRTDKTIVIAKTGSYPVLGVASEIYNGTGTSYSHISLVNNSQWFYRIYSWNNSGYMNTTYRQAHETTMGYTIKEVNVVTTNAVGSYTQVLNSTKRSYYVNFTATGNASGIQTFNHTINSIHTIQKSFSTSLNKWRVWVNSTGNTTPIHQVSNLVNATGTHEYVLNNTGYWDYANVTGNSTGLVVIENIVNATGTHEYAFYPDLGVSGEWWVWANYTGNASAPLGIHLFENIVNATGTHEYASNATDYLVWANYTGTGNSSGNITVLNKNNRYVVYLIIGTLFGFIAFGVTNVSMSGGNKKKDD